MGNSSISTGDKNKKIDRILNNSINKFKNE